MKTRRWSVIGVLTAFALTMVLSVISVVPASASVKGRRNTAWALTGVSAYQLLRGHTGTGLVVGAGAAYAWKRAHDEQRAEARHRRYHRHARHSHRHLAQYSQNR